MGTRRGASSAPVLRRRCAGAGAVAAARRPAVFPRKGDADQLFDVAQIAHFLGARDQRDRNALGAGARGAADAVDVGLGNVGQIEVHHMADAVESMPRAAMSVATKARIRRSEVVSARWRAFCDLLP
jgi:hypothetical protein